LIGPGSKNAAEIIVASWFHSCKSTGFVRQHSHMPKLPLARFAPRGMVKPAAPVRFSDGGLACAGLRALARTMPAMWPGRLGKPHVSRQLEPKWLRTLRPSIGHLMRWAPTGRLQSPVACALLEFQKVEGFTPHLLAWCLGLPVTPKPPMRPKNHVVKTKCINQTRILDVCLDGGAENATK
jgi:hypothetical protein